jgi:hypothetical protein
MGIPVLFGLFFGVCFGVGNVISDMQLLHKPAILKKKPPTA